jgi:ABC-2 type transport system ATP-binding protein
MNAIDISHVSKSYPIERGFKQMLQRKEKRPALVDVSFSIRNGECFGVLGLNGAGKTTLLKMISTLIVPDSGTVTVQGHDVLRDGRAVRECIGICSSDERAYYMRISAWENLQFFGKLQGLGKSALHRRIEELAQWLGIADRLHSQVQTYSTGMKQRLALIRALLADPPVLLLDEPTKALDPLSASNFRETVRDRLVKDAAKTVLIATNQLDEAWSMCDRVAILHEQRVAAVGTPLEIDAKAPAGTREQPLFGYLRHVAGGV